MPAGDSALDRLLSKIVTQIGAVVDNAAPSMLLFWASNSLKLLASLAKDKHVYGVSVAFEVSSDWN